MAGKVFGYPDEQSYRNAIEEELKVRQEGFAKPIRETAVARESSDAREPDDLVLKAAGKLTQALSAHKSDMGVGDAYGLLQQMVENADTAEDAALAVITFAGEYPAYANHGVEVLDENWGEYGRDAISDVVEQLSWTEAVEEQERAEEAYNEHVSKRSALLGELSNQIARRDGEDVRAVTAAMAGTDETLFLGSDQEAAANLLGHREVAREARDSLAQEGFLREFDDEVEQRYAGRLHTDEERDKHHRDRAAANAQMTSIDPERAFERGRRDGVRRAQKSAGLPFDEKEFEAELRRHDRPEWDAPARREREAQEAQERRERGEE